MSGAPEIRVSRPELTMPKAEAALLREEYTRAEVILEYGSGGSTVVAAEMAGKTIFSVESDLEWTKMMRAWFAQNPPKSEVDVIWSDIGPTKEWGHPVNQAQWKRFAEYPLKVWELAEFRHPDVVLVDGRFRVGCVLATMYRIARPVVVLFDDYAERKQYHKIEEFAGTPKMAGRMARFEVAPQAVPAERLLDIFRMMTQP